MNSTAMNPESKNTLMMPESGPHRRILTDLELKHMYPRVTDRDITGSDMILKVILRYQFLYLTRTMLTILSSALNQ